jgi:hypothetical protein
MLVLEPSRVGMSLSTEDAAGVRFQPCTLIVSPPAAPVSWSNCLLDTLFC